MSRISLISSSSSRPCRGCRGHIRHIPDAAAAPTSAFMMISETNHRVQRRASTHGSYFPETRLGRLAISACSLASRIASSRPPALGHVLDLALHNEGADGPCHRARSGRFFVDPELPQPSFAGDLRKLEALDDIVASSSNLTNSVPARRVHVKAVWLGQFARSASSTSSGVSHSLDVGKRRVGAQHSASGEVCEVPSTAFSHRCRGISRSLLAKRLSPSVMLVGPALAVRGSFRAEAGRRRAESARPRSACVRVSRQHHRHRSGCRTASRPARRPATAAG